ncbi:MAG: galactosyltransferase-related protein [Cyclobacteriaceae bacterium]
MNPRISILTLVHERRDHLVNLIMGLSRSKVMPNELVITFMNEAPYDDLPGLPFPIRMLRVDSAETAIPLAEARNGAVQQADGDLLVFLDVDCIPDPALVGRFRQAAEQFDGLMMGDIRYLPPQTAFDPCNFPALRKKAVAHPDRPVVHELVQPESRYELFWTLSFALQRELWDRLGGLDEGFRGYGGEDTDLAFTTRKMDIPFALVDAVCYHQHHAVYRPPLQHFDDILVNAIRFHKKWDIWPMDGWLKAFADMGLIRWDKKSTEITRVRAPSEEEIQAARHEAPAGF